MSSGWKRGSMLLLSKPKVQAGREEQDPHLQCRRKCRSFKKMTQHFPPETKMSKGWLWTSEGCFLEGIVRKVLLWLLGNSSWIGIGPTLASAHLRFIAYPGRPAEKIIYPYVYVFRM